MHPEDIWFMEHMALNTPHSLDEFCTIAQRALGLPAFELDAENETEWGIAVKDGVEYNVSRPFADGQLKAWDATCPEGSNFGLILIFPRSSSATPETSEPVVSAVASRLASAFATPVVHHRTWLAPGTSLARSAKYQSAVG